MTTAEIELNEVKEIGEISHAPLPTTDFDRLSETLASHYKKAPHDLKWNSVCYSIHNKSILSNAWGEVSSGKICAIMGPSGAGKSSLLNVLAGRCAPSSGVHISGKFSVGNKEINPVTFRKNIAYVMQEDALLPTATPREALIFSASLRLPPETPHTTILELVEGLLVELGLEDCADTMIGGALVTGISGGEKKRTSIGVEIITNPSLLFLDEPTSGLDSYSAFTCVNLLKRVASHNTTVLCTIHQPSSEVFFIFDTVIFMRSGRVLYNGPVGEISTYLSQFGFDCPMNYNPSDFVMFLAQTESAEAMDSKGMFMVCDGHCWENHTERISSSVKEMIVSKASFWMQLRWLIYREFLDTTRDHNSLVARFGTTIFLSLLISLIFLGAGGKNNANPDEFNSHFGALTLATMSSMMGAAQPIMLHFPFERPMFLREYSTGTYAALSYFISKACVELPFNFIQVCIQYLILYFIIDFQGKWIFLVLCAWGLGISSASISICLGCALPDVKSVTEFAPLLFVPQLLFAGFFIRITQIPVFLRWAQYLCALKYAMNLLLIVEFNDTLPSCHGLARYSCEGVLSNNNVSYDRWWVYILLLFTLFLGFRIIAAAILVHNARRFY